MFGNVRTVARTGCPLSGRRVGPEHDLSGEQLRPGRPDMNIYGCYYVCHALLCFIVSYYVENDSDQTQRLSGGRTS